MKHKKIAFCIAFYAVILLLVGNAVVQVSLNIRDSRIARHTIESEMDFTAGNYRILMVPESAFDRFFPDVSLIGTTDDLGPDLFLLPDGTIIRNITIQDSPKGQIQLRNFKTWMWSCDWSQEGDRYGTDAERALWKETACLGGSQPSNEKRLAYTVRAEALAARNTHVDANPAHEHDCWLGENMILTPVPNTETE